MHLFVCVASKTCFPAQITGPFPSKGWLIWSMQIFCRRRKPVSVHLLSESHVYRVSPWQQIQCPVVIPLLYVRLTVVNGRRNQELGDQFKFEDNPNEPDHWCKFSQVSAISLLAFYCCNCSKDFYVISCKFYLGLKEFIAKLTVAVTRTIN